MKNLQKIFNKAPIRVESEDAMLALGQAIAAELEPGDVLGLVGDLGAGKTHLVQGILRGVGHLTRARAPRFLWCMSTMTARCRWRILIFTA